MQRYDLAIIVPLIEELRVLRELVPSHIHNPEVEDAIYYPLDLGEPDYQAVIVIRPQPGPMTFFVFLSDYKPASTNAPLPPLPTTGWEETTVLAAAMARNPYWPPIMVGGLRRRL